MRSKARPSKASVVSDFRRDQILQAARQTFIQCGVTDTSVERIAKSAGVAKGTVYLYYKSKDDILRQLLTADLAEFHAETVATITSPGTIPERLRRYFLATLSFFERKREFIEHCQLDMSADVRKKARGKLGLVFAAQADAWAAVLAAGPATGDVGSPADSRALIDPHAGIARTIVSLAHGLAIQRLRGWHTSSVEDAAALATALVSHGVIKS